MNLKRACDEILEQCTSGERRLPGVVALVTDRDGDIYAGAAVARRMGADPMSKDSVFAIFSTTKAITGTAALQCLEEGLLDLDAPAARYAPEIARLQVIEGFDESGQPMLRAPRSQITVRQLFLHTAGFGYDFFDETYKRLAEEHGQPPVAAANRRAIETPLLFDPGERWQYGTSIDWLGQVVEGIRGRRLGEVMRERIFEPL